MSRFAIAVLAALACGGAVASEVSLGPTTIQKLVAERLFSQDGRWYVVDNGACFAYFDHPRTRLTPGRLVLEAHLSARVGIPVADGCAGGDVATNVTISAKPVGKGSSLTLTDIRIDHVDDSSAKDALDVIQTLAPQALPEGFSFDVLSILADKPVSAAGVPVSVDQLKILKTETRRDAIVVTFDLSLSAP